MGKFFFVLCLFYNLLLPFNSSAGDTTKVKKTLKNPFEYKRGRFQMAFFPVSSYDPASGIEFGAMPVFTISPKKQPDSTDFYRSSSLATHLTYSTKNWANVRSEGQFYTTKGFNFVVLFQYLNAPDYFYGIGNDTINKNPSKFQNRYMKFCLEFSKCKNKVHFWGFKTDVQLQYIDDIQLNVLNPQISGYDGGTFLGIGPLYKYDSRNDVNFPSRGYLIQTSITQTVEVQDLRHTFSSYSIDIRKYILFLKTFILATQANISHTSGDVPFFKLSTIGGKYNLRGISNKYKYIDKDAKTRHFPIEIPFFKECIENLI